MPNKRRKQIVPVLDELDEQQRDIRLGIESSPVRRVASRSGRLHTNDLITDPPHVDGVIRGS